MKPSHGRRTWVKLWVNDWLEADVASAWKLDPVLNQKIVGTNRVHMAKGPVN